jgi:hypothetical protein
VIGDVRLPGTRRFNQVASAQLLVCEKFDDSTPKGVRERTGDLISTR